jgi:hypothetical protein
MFKSIVVAALLGYTIAAPSNESAPARMLQATEGRMRGGRVADMIKRSMS